MPKMLVANVSPGAVVAEDVYSSDGIMLLSKGALFRREFIERLEQNGIYQLKIKSEEHEIEDEIECIKFDEDVLSKIEAKRAIKENVILQDIIYERTRSQAQKQIKKVMLGLTSMGRVNISKISAIVTEILDQLLTQKDIMLTLSSLRSVDDYTYDHSVNVCVLSLVVGIDLGLNKESLQNLGVGAILHDIGKVGIPEEILKKPGKLTAIEFDEIKRHTEYGYGILMNADISEEAASIALFHHEKYDGSGYNNKLNGQQIPLLSRIVAVTDVYDAMSSDRVYKKKMAPDKVYREMIDLADRHFDRDIMENFVDHLSLYPVGIGIVLNTNHKGVVIAQNKLLPESPVVRIFKKEDSKIDYTDIDLSKTKYLYIKETF